MTEKAGPDRVKLIFGGFEKLVSLYSQGPLLQNVHAIIDVLEAFESKRGRFAFKDNFDGLIQMMLITTQRKLQRRISGGNIIHVILPIFFPE